ncbi:hypothetical protein B4U80_04134 [Leptotrombidium deliense]|uniref:S1 RNA-binding domain-containing protein 1-like protein n=1 Tax=Leptotrombidium deliense TaxID=299467 RepID=A0A443SAB1_9ACAR|nr:hypothetical protein B4U80_04134 [Leptotrombidium deliense]
MDLKEVFSKCMDISEVEKLYLPYETEDDEAVRARHLCLDESAKQILAGSMLDASDFVKIDCNGLETLDKINSGWQAVITDMICKDTDVMSYLSTLYKEEVPVIETELEDEKVAEVYQSGGESIVRKYLKFKSWKMPINNVDTQTVFKINRGEKEGLIRVYVIFNELIEKKLRQFCMTKWSKCSPSILSNCIYTAWDNFMKPNFAQHIRWELTNEAHKVALKVFRDNVKYLLLEEPIRGKTVLGIDPGYDNGCKLAVVSPWGVPIASGIVYVTTESGKINTCSELKRLVLTFECDIIALGNGKGCREIETLLRCMINQNQFRPFEITYKVVSESGVSCYSVSEEAAKEFPDLSPNIISAVSIARRLQDPLSELVKTDPKKLEVGMYLRDIEAERVEEIFGEVVVECVSFVGVDVNIASSVLLSKVSGITPEIANNIIMFRIQNGPFKSREQLRSIDGVTSKHFEQFAGFVRIIPETSQLLGENFNFFDATIIHPESYDDAEKLLKYIGVEKQSIGTPYMSDVIEHVLKRFEIRDLAVFCSTSITTITFLLDVFRKSLNHDVRFEQKKSCYKSTITHWDDLRPNMQLSGRVVNVTPIGAFIDVGLGGGQNAYLPPSKDNDLFGKLVPRQIVIVQVTRIDTFTRKFKVRLKRILE